MSNQPETSVAHPPGRAPGPDPHGPAEPAGRPAPTGGAAPIGPLASADPHDPVERLQSRGRRGARAARRGRTARPALLALGTFTAGTDAFLVSGVLPGLAGDLHVSMAVAGQTVTVFALTYAVGAPLLAAITGRMDRRTVMLLALALLAAANAGSALAPNFAVLLVARFAAGIAAAQFTPNATAIVIATAPAQRRGRDLSVLLGGMSAGTVLGLPAGTLLGGQAGWRAAFWLVTGVALVALLTLAGTLPAIRLPRSGWRRRLRPLRDPALARVLATTAAIMVGPYATMTFIAPVTAPATHGGATALSLLLMLNGICATAGTAVAGRLVDRFGPRRVLVGQLLVLTGALAALAAGRRSPVAAAVLVGVWGLAGFGTMVAQQHRLARLAGPAAPLVMGLNGSAIYVGSTLGAVVGGGVLDRSGAGALPLASAAFLLGALALAALPPEPS